MSRFFPLALPGRNLRDDPARSLTDQADPFPDDDALLPLPAPLFVKKLPLALDIRGNAFLVFVHMLKLKPHFSTQRLDSAFFAAFDQPVIPGVGFPAEPFVFHHVCQHSGRRFRFRRIACVQIIVQRCFPGHAFPSQEPTVRYGDRPYTHG